MAKIHIILANLGSPSAPEKKAVNRYLKEFLSDRRVIDFPRPWWNMILFMIRQFRSQPVADVYKSVWGEKYGPLIEISYKQQDLLLERLKELYPQHQISVSIGMSYQSPNLVDVTKKVFEEQPDHVILFPLYPQFSSTTVLPCIDAFNKAFKHENVRFVPQYSIINNYYRNPLYIAALANTIKEKVEELAPGKTPAEYFTEENKLFVSYHGIPTRYATKMHDPYPAQCEATTEHLVKTLGLRANSYQLAYQSKFGKEPWLLPALNESLEAHAKAYPNASALVMAPAFSCDCIETLEENAEENKEVFREAGGKGYDIIPCLNYRQDHISMMVDILRPYIELQGR